MSNQTPLFRYEDDPALPGWKRWELIDQPRFNHFLGPLHVRRHGEEAQVRMVPGPQHSNLAESIHGGTLLGFMDVALFAAARAFGLIDGASVVTLDLSAQFLDSSVVDAPIVAHVDLLRETGRFLFLRGVVRQKDKPIAAFSGTVRKASPARQ